MNIYIKKNQFYLSRLARFAKLDFYPEGRLDTNSLSLLYYYPNYEISFFGTRYQENFNIDHVYVFNQQNGRWLHCVSRTGFRVGNPFYQQDQEILDLMSIAIAKFVANP
jgi:hypothetical protein